MLLVNKVNLQQLSIKNQVIGAYIHFDSFLTNTYKIGMVYKLVNMFSNMIWLVNIPLILIFLWEIFQKNGYPEN